MTATDNSILSPTEQDALEELQKRVPKDINQRIFDDPHVYHRFLRARDYNVDEAEKMLKATLKWRNEWDADNILTTFNPPEILENVFRQHKICYDKEGCPVYFLSVGKIDVNGLMKSVREIDFKKYLVFLYGRFELDLHAQCKMLNRKLAFVFIYDLLDITFATATNKKGIELIIWYVQMLQNNYPERLKAIHFLNVSSLFAFPFSIIKHFLASSILNKMHLHGADGWKEQFANKIDVNELPAVLGGKKTDPDGNPDCITMIYQGGKIDEKYYLSKKKKTLQNQPGVQKLVLSRAAFSEIKIEIQEAGSIIEWEFEIKTRDIGFGLFFNKEDSGDDEVEELVALQRVNTAEFSETGMYKCQRVGIYVMLFDNSYSWVRSKEIYYLTKIISPKDHEKQMIEL